MVNLNVSMFKEDIERDLVHMMETMCLSEPPFQCPHGSTKDMECESKKKVTSRSSEEEAKTLVMKY